MARIQSSGQDAGMKGHQFGGTHGINEENLSSSKVGKGSDNNPEKDH